MSETDHLPDLTHVDWAPTRDAGLARLRAFVPMAGRAYARGRNLDRGPQDRSNVSALSPWIRRRLVTEQEVLAAVLQQHRLADAQKFVDEVFWRSYWKGWLQQRPQVYARYRLGCTQWLARLELALQWDAGRDLDVARRYQQAVAGRTGIACFDAWMQELLTLGWLHNHARMWFASLWIFTLKLPWELGAALFEHHLLDADPASNTLSWRWVAGLHTRGKHYVARAENIRVNTLGRFDPQGQLDEQPAALTEAASALNDDRALAEPVWQPGWALGWEVLERASQLLDGRRVALLLHDEDLSLQPWLARVADGGLNIVAVAGLQRAAERGLVGLGPGLAPPKGPVRVPQPVPMRGPIRGSSGRPVTGSKTGSMTGSVSPTSTPVTASIPAQSTPTTPIIPTPAERFRQAAIADALQRAAWAFGLLPEPAPAPAHAPHASPDPCTPLLAADQLAAWAAAAGVTDVVTPLAPVGPTAQALQQAEQALAQAGVRLTVVPSDYDRMTWPHATAGFFKFREHIPGFVQTLMRTAASDDRACLV